MSTTQLAPTNRALTESDKLRAEAKERLHELLCFMGRNDHEAVERIVDCIIGAATLEAAYLLGQAATPKAPQ
jgi:hypothetical protein